MKKAAVFLMFVAFIGSLPAFGSDAALATSGSSVAEPIVVEPEQGDSDILPRTFGTIDQTSVVVGAGHLRAANNGVGWVSTSGFSGISVYQSSGSGDWWGNVALPNGAKIDFIELEGCDTAAVGSLRFGVARSDGPGAGDGNITPVGSTGAVPGCGWFTVSPTSSTTVDNFNDSYFLFLNYGTNTSGNRAIALRVYYTLQISPAPAFATFNDVGISAFGFREIEALADSGITAGCGGGNFCPNRTLTRVEMAIFLARALGLHWPN